MGKLKSVFIIVVVAVFLGFIREDERGRPWIVGFGTEERINFPLVSDYRDLPWVGFFARIANRRYLRWKVVQKNSDRRLPVDSG